VARRDRRVDPGDLLLELPELDLDRILELVLGDRLAIDRRSRGEVVAVELDDRHPDEDRDGDGHCQAEADVEVEIAPALAVTRGSRRTGRDGFGSEGHGVMRSCRKGLVGRGLTRPVSYSMSVPEPADGGPARPTDQPFGTA
jgi:hypothetical protein